ncbi:SCO0607 family lipoprotein [Micromonospora thermarum]|uniref:Lipoprotein n=1 Tax=Micromonospora thermarum TaxID=2720024 RepID=A0ABX0Z7M2_9ACTN|nr:hypothetical protein [Micromonospora thermarum]NJP31940.1 hypothetical protein [Micromonospora thermarum]
MAKRTCALFAVAGLATLSLVGGCAFREAVCGSDHYPVKAVNSTGSTCVKKGEQPPQGYVRYPDGKVPKYVDDEWDRYWREHRLDENGNESTP